MIVQSMENRIENKIDDKDTLVVSATGSRTLNIKDELAKNIVVKNMSNCYGEPYQGDYLLIGSTRHSASPSVFVDCPNLTFFSHKRNLGRLRLVFKNISAEEIQIDIIDCSNVYLVFENCVNLKRVIGLKDVDIVRLLRIHNGGFIDGIKANVCGISGKYDTMECNKYKDICGRVEYLMNLDVAIRLSNCSEVTRDNGGMLSLRYRNIENLILIVKKGRLSLADNGEFQNVDIKKIKHIIIEDCGYVFIGHDKIFLTIRSNAMDVNFEFLEKLEINRVDRLFMCAVMPSLNSMAVSNVSKWLLDFAISSSSVLGELSIENVAIFVCRELLFRPDYKYIDKYNKYTNSVNNISSIFVKSKIIENILFRNVKLHNCTYNFGTNVDVCDIWVEMINPRLERFGLYIESDRLAKKRLTVQIDNANIVRLCAAGVGLLDLICNSDVSIDHLEDIGMVKCSSLNNSERCTIKDVSYITNYPKVTELISNSLCDNSKIRVILSEDLHKCLSALHGNISNRILFFAQKKIVELINGDSVKWHNLRDLVCLGRDIEKTKVAFELMENKLFFYKNKSYDHIKKFDILPLSNFQLFKILTNVYLLNNLLDLKMNINRHINSSVLNNIFLCTPRLQTCVVSCVLNLHGLNINNPNLMLLVYVCASFVDFSKITRVNLKHIDIVYINIHNVMNYAYADISVFTKSQKVRHTVLTVVGSSYSESTCVNESYGWGSDSKFMFININSRIMRVLIDASRIPRRQNDFYNKNDLSIKDVAFDVINSKDGPYYDVSPFVRKPKKI